MLIHKLVWKKLREKRPEKIRIFLYLGPITNFAQDHLVLTMGI